MPRGVYQRRFVPIAERFWPKVDKSGDCWVWTAGRSADGYGLLKADDNRRVAYAHRVAYALAVGPIPDGLTLDHLCRNRACVNPAHLDPVTNAENILRGSGVTAQQARQTHCQNGHPLDEANTYRWRNTRRCRTCQRVAR